MQTIAPECASFTMESNEPQIELYKLLSEALPDFHWRCGDSDAIGEHLSGSNSDDVVIRLFLDEQPAIYGFITFDIAWKGEHGRDNRKRECIEKIFSNLDASTLKCVRSNAPSTS